MNKPITHPEIAARFVGLLTFDQVADAALAEVKDRLDGDAAVLVWPAEADQKFQVFVRRSDKDELIQFDLGEESTGPLPEMLKEARIMVFGDLSQHARLREALTLADMASALSAPILFGRRPRGFMFVCFQSRRLPSDSEISWLDDIAQFASRAFRAAMRFERVKGERERLDDLRQMLFDTQSHLLKEKQHIEQMAVEVRESRDAVVEGKEYTDNIIGSMLDFLLVVDNAGRLERVNQATCEVLGYKKEELIGRPAAEFVAAAGSIFDPASIAAMGQDSIIRDQELALRTKTKEVVPVSISGAVLFGQGNNKTLVTVSRDMRQVRQLLADLDQIYNSAPVGMRVIDFNFQVLSYNKTMEEMSGRSFDPGHPIRCDEQFRSEYCGTDACTVRKLATGIEKIDIEVEKQAADGRRIFCRLQASPFRDISGRVIGLIEVFSDITQNKQLMEELLRSNQDLQDFAYVASHDLQEPLRKIRTFSDRLQMKCSEVLPQQGRNYLDRMKNAAERMHLLIDSLLSFSRVSTRAKPFVEVDLARLVKDVLEDLDLLIQESSGRLEVQVEGTIEGDSVQLRQLLYNLVNNALKFHRPGVPPNVRIKGFKNGDGRYQIMVEDNGIGFEEIYADRIFGIFERLHGRKEYSGTGIGLAICNKIAQRHDGSITVQSQPGTGSTFLVLLPIKHHKREVAK